MLFITDFVTQSELDELGAAEERSRLQKFLKSEASSGSGAAGSIAARGTLPDQGQSQPGARETTLACSPALKQNIQDMS